MRIRRTIAVLGVVAAALASLVAPGVLFADEGDLDIQVAPSTLNLSYQGDWVTVHTDLAYADGHDLVWDLNGAEANHTYSDACGNLVVKFKVGAIAAVVEASPIQVTMTLTGEDDTGVVYEGSDDVRVIDIAPLMKNR